jgi:uncharacterized membrane protein YgaE (UPF0421/DUF939 family)
MRDFIMSAYENCLLLAAWIIIIVFGIAGYINSHFIFLILIPAFGYDSLNLSRLIGVIIGLLLGIIVAVVSLGLLFQIADIRKNIEKAI